MTAYLCVYRQVIPRDTSRLLAATLAAAEHEDIAELLASYEAGSFYDWGDDPSFFSATLLQGGPTYAGWGVCRRDVRAKLRRGDVAVFVCARQLAPGGAIDYFLVGFATIGQRIEDRQRIWNERRLAPYRRHLNVLVRYDQAGNEEQFERFAPGHDDWSRRAESPYLIFNPALSRFNLVDPLRVAVALPSEVHETWLVDDPRVEDLRAFLFDELQIRHLRTSAAGYSHPRLNIGRLMDLHGVSADVLRQRLSEFV